jgi:hypothetical protein
MDHQNTPLQLKIEIAEIGRRNRTARSSERQLELKFLYDN